MRAPPSSQSLAAGGTALDALRLSARKDPKGAIHEAAKQFEALFMQELMKSMRATTMSDGMLDNHASEMATGMLDQQYAQQMTGLPGGLADAIERQLAGRIGAAVSAATSPVGGTPATTGLAGRWRPVGAAEGLSPAASPGAAMSARALRAAYSQIGGPSGMPATAAAAPGEVAAAPGAAPAGRPDGLGRAEQFVLRHQATAEAVAAESGIPASFMLAQAAHETGWGRREILQSDGKASNNLFGIKAGAGWSGPVAVATTTEVIDGVARKVQARFRAYSSPEESFRDYARLISTSPRYEGVMRAGHDASAFARGLQQAGYATDPAYASKLGRVISTTERLQQQLDV
ncbi:MAG: flagellar assembly peptidoglycan hydrolase FlgJ [Leptothrix sp. (in: b-proteobacteria)]